MQGNETLITFIIHNIKTHIFVSIFFLILTFILLFGSASIFQIEVTDLFNSSNNILICSIGSWQLCIHPIGFCLPILFSCFLFFKKNFSVSFLLLSLLPVSFMAFLMTTFDLDEGIISPFPLWLFPPFMAAVIIVLNRDKLKDDIYFYSYSISVFGMAIGADVVHLPLLFQYSPQYPMQAIIGGGSIFDLIFISGIFSLLFVRILLVLIERFNLEKTVSHPINRFHFTFQFK